MTRLLIYEATYERLRPRLEAADPALEPVTLSADGRLALQDREVTAETAGALAAWASSEAFLGPAARAFSVAMLKSPQLKWVQSAAAGFDHPIFRQLVDKGLTLTTSHGQSVGMADYVVAGVLDHFQGGPARRAAQAQHEWRRLSFRELADTSWLVFGFGAIGQGVGRRARGFGAKVVGVRRDRAADPAADEIVTLDAARARLGEADVVVFCLPLDAKTRSLADAEFFAAMKPGSVFVNVGRGGLVDEAALLAALDKGTPEHAVLDVFETEPLPPDSPFWTHPRVSLTAHSSGATNGQDGRNDELFLENLRRFAAGEALLNLARAEDVRAAHA
ncbi:MAG TPA: D-2-hydroxyacid dehydrogenase [Caulobacteraceae bacterium]|jgi:phosphoglycerate dehydrogenase-like enzyme|nr:D-2-hydroxyacid dehydrogenase [Caulobacteraceae bacterium]